jgi:hypothetical protein
MRFRLLVPLSRRRIPPRALPSSCSEASVNYRRLIPALAAASACLLAISRAAAQQGARPLAMDDAKQVQEVSDAQPSNDGEGVAHTVSAVDKRARPRLRG